MYSGHPLQEIHPPHIFESASDGDVYSRAKDAMDIPSNFGTRHPPYDGRSPVRRDIIVENLREAGVKTRRVPEALVVHKKNGRLRPDMSG